MSSYAWLHQAQVRYKDVTGEGEGGEEQGHLCMHTTFPSGCYYMVHMQDCHPARDLIVLWQTIENNIWADRRNLVTIIITIQSHAR